MKPPHLGEQQHMEYIYFSSPIYRGGSLPYFVVVVFVLPIIYYIKIAASPAQPQLRVPTVCFGDPELPLLKERQ